jgi:hypothetical protein
MAVYEYVIHDVDLEFVADIEFLADLEFLLH